ncbi:YncE family protein [Actinomadura sp. 9N215]|uniref:YncE family protein n=1 Tax=Actinomadura sp. 9N215 TaxID=3375150 RepID=UPI0037A9DDD3
MKKVATGLVALTAGLGLVAAAVSASAAGGGPLPLPVFADIVVDDAHKRVFITGGASTNAVVVADYSGHVRKTIDGRHGASGMVPSADGKTLYVALAAGDAISAIDTKTLKETARQSLAG